jgi:hypothetical protein
VAKRRHAVDEALNALEKGRVVEAPEVELVNVRRVTHRIDLQRDLQIQRAQGPLADVAGVEELHVASSLLSETPQIQHPLLLAAVFGVVANGREALLEVLERGGVVLAYAGENGAGEAPAPGQVR